MLAGLGIPAESLLVNSFSFMNAYRFLLLAIILSAPLSGIAQLGLIKGEVFLKQNAKKEGVKSNRPRNPIYRGRGIGARVHAWKPGYSPIPTANASGHYA